jgi:hypothetical protein
MNPSILPSKSVDKNYLLRLLNGNTEMMGVVLNEIFQNIPHCLKEINSGLNSNDSLNVAAYASRAKSAFNILREDHLAQAFLQIETAARNGKMSDAEVLFTSIFNTTLSRISFIQEAA